MRRKVRFLSVPCSFHHRGQGRFEKETQMSHYDRMNRIFIHEQQKRRKEREEEKQDLAREYALEDWLEERKKTQIK